MNIYKLNDENVEDGLLNKGYSCDGRKNVEGVELKLYIKRNEENHTLPWSWVIEEFDEEGINYVKNPGGIIYLSLEENDYAVTFGSGHFAVNQFADINFPIEILKRIEVNKIKNAGLINPGMTNYKNIAIFKNASEEIFNTESAVEKAKIEISDLRDNLFTSKIIEFGNSIKFNCEKNLSNILQCVKFFNEIENGQVRRQISEYKIINNREEIESLNNNYLTDEFFDRNDFEFMVNDADLIGTSYFFSEEASRKYINNRTAYDFSDNDLKRIKSNLGITITEMLDDRIRYTNLENNIEYYKKVKDLLYFEIDEESVIYSSGKWYKYNSDFVNYINKKIQASHPKYLDNFNYTETVNNFQVEGNIKYTEFKYNNYMCNIENNYILMDRKTVPVSGNSIEICDIYDTVKKSCIAVKIGKSSNSLGYNVEQSLTALKYLLNNHKQFSMDGEIYEVDEMTLLFVLDRNTMDIIEDSENEFDISSLKMLGLKRNIVIWLDEVRNAGLKPNIIFANKEL